MKIDPSSGKGFLARGGGARRLGPWLLAHAGVVALVMIVAGFVVQVVATYDRSLDPDEALHFILVNRPGPINAYRSTRYEPHPPLFYSALHFWTRLGHSEAFLRLLPAAFGGAFLWLTYSWTSRAFGGASGLFTVAALLLSSMWIPLSAEVRNYSLFLMLSAATLVEFEKSVDTESEARMLLSSILLFLAMLSHYSALFIAPSLAIYELIRLRAGHPSRRLTSVWACCQGGAAAMCAFVYLTQVRGLRGSRFEEEAISGWLGVGYLHRGQDNPFWFVARQTWEVFRYFFGSGGLAAVALLLAVTGVAILAMRRQPAAILVALPYLLGVTAGMLGLYPFSQTRHSAYLLLFVSVAIGVALSALVAARRWTALLALGIFVCLSWNGPLWATSPHSLSQMHLAVDHLHRSVPPGSILFADQQTRTLLSYYLGRDEPNDEKLGVGHFLESNAGRYCLVGPPTWNLDRTSLGEEVEHMIRVYRFPAGQWFWVIRLGSDYDPVAALSRQFPTAVLPTVLKFGNLWIIQVWRGGSQDI